MVALAVLRCATLLAIFTLVGVVTAQPGHIWDMGPRQAGPAALRAPVPAVQPAGGVPMGWNNGGRASQPLQQAAASAPPMSLEEYEKGLNSNDAPPSPQDNLLSGAAPQSRMHGPHGMAALPRGRRLIKDATLNDLEDGDR